ncbi:MAG: endonuclease [Actinomycetia bacterium]|nr:endonuclease [Actinomycetes bacterium]
MQPATEASAESAFVAGFVAAEGAFIASGRPPVFSFVVGLGATDADTAELLHGFFGVGYVRWFARRKAHYDDEVRWTVRALADQVNVIVPFMDAHLPVSHKRAQYLVWRDALFEHWEHGARRQRTCTLDGCDAPHRAHGLCRHHLYVHHRT